MTSSTDGPAAPEPEAPPRHVQLERAYNFRDLGGYTGLEGRRVRWRTLFRSDGLERLSTTDRAVLLDELRIVEVVDLRSAREGERRGRFSVEGTGAVLHQVPIFDETRRLIEPGGDDFTMTALYARMIEGSSDRFVEALRLVAGAAGPAVFHCAAGKDRTGLLAALLLGLLGVSETDILTDYARSGPSMVRMREGWQRRLAKDRAAGRPSRFADEEEWARLADELLSANRETMATTLAWLDGRHGSIAGWADDHGFGSDEVEALRSRLLEPADRPGGATSPAANVPDEVP